MVLPWVPWYFFIRVVQLNSLLLERFRKDDGSKDDGRIHSTEIVLYYALAVFIVTCFGTGDGDVDDVSEKV